MSGAGVTITAKAEMPETLDIRDLRRPVVMQGLRAIARNAAKQSKTYLSIKGPSKPGQFPGKEIGLMRRHVKVHSAKRQDRIWVRVQVDSFKGEDGAGMWYPAALMHGRKKGDLKPRRDPIEAVFSERASEINGEIEKLIIKAL